ncbi:MAG: glycosyltransferase family 4 protein [Solirubrobacterales bacterium]|nr:glycosyltransferase family 4 protein [Solirubrobacterales bacterium]
MRVLIFHAFLLRGTGSNVYNASLAPALARLGHEVHLLCQDRSAADLPWVDRYVELVADRQPAPIKDEDKGGEGGSVSVWIPEIGGLLPVYVKDAYEGFEVKTFTELSEAELDRYLEANVAAVRSVAEAAGGIDAALANHLVMGPAILARAGLGEGDGGPGFAVKVHGSALEYAVKPEPDRFLPYALEGARAASAILAGSRHTAESLWQALDDETIRAKTRLGPPGVDTELFSPVPPEVRRTRLIELATSLSPERAGQRVAGGGGPPTGPAADTPRPAVDPPGPAADAPEPAVWGRDPARAAVAIRHLAAAEGPRVVFVGKLIVSKGVDLLLAAWPLVHRAQPASRLIVVGFGEYAEGLERLWAALSSGDLDQAREIAAAGRGLEGGEPSPLAILSAFLAEPPDGYLEAAEAAVDSVEPAGRLEHGEVARLIPSCDALVFPSTFPEAFGMVAAEAASAGVLPVSADHSGMAEVSGELAAGLEPRLADLVSFPLGIGAVEAIASRVERWLALPEAERAATGGALREVVARLWSWEGVARSVLAASAGKLDRLTLVTPR